MLKSFTNAILLLMCTFGITPAQQQWNWAVRAGSPNNGYNSWPYEMVVDMATDPNGNVYYLAKLKAELSGTMTGYNGPLAA
jgi:hypothetical protein